tara:strand:- start:1704 stop:2774 length:1071 start_codon:yes stop_codon:yes gene_type:complete
MNSILLTGGCGFIGSHTCICLLEKGYNIIIVDSNVNSSPNSLDAIKKIFFLKEIDIENKLTFYKGDIRDHKFLRDVFKSAIDCNRPINSVVHFAGLKSVKESVIHPILYWENNLIGSINLFRIMEEFKCKNIVFSSSATVYGINNLDLLEENMQLKPANPYGETKLAIEKVLENLFHSKKREWRIANLRYFNPIGAHSSGLLGENPLNVPDNLFPFICKVASGNLEKLSIFGNDWETKDGTCIRDFIHVMDLAEAHSAALDFIFQEDPKFINLNIGTGLGTSVLKLLKTFIKVNKCDVPFKFCQRREGDVPILIANNKLALSKLTWKPTRNIVDMCKDGWNWQKLNPNGLDNKEFS